MRDRFDEKLFDRMNFGDLSCPEVLAQWNRVMDGYEERFEKYADTLLEEDTLLDSE